MEYLKCAENLLILKKKPERNIQLKSQYRYTRPFELINKGDKIVLSTFGLKEDYEIL
jgi:hypothetical protein